MESGLRTTAAPELNIRCFEKNGPQKPSATSSAVDGNNDEEYVGNGTARQGRDKQRWDNQTRLITGCVPIVKGGGILLCGAKKKKEWIIPKGGWEDDETLEDGAMRECYEECGVYGDLGSPLESITFETRKGKGEREKGREGGSSPKSDHSDDASEPSPLTPPLTSPSSSPSSSPFKPHSPRLCRATLFPLYVTEVLEVWPENSRARKIVGIDEAIMEVSRPELKAFLIQVRERGLHLRGV